MTNKVKPFYIKITDDMTPQMVQDAFDKCVDAGAVAGDGMNEAQSKCAYPFRYNFGSYCLFGVDRELTTRTYSTEFCFGNKAQEITLDQLGEWLGLEVEGEWKSGDECIIENDHGYAVFCEHEKLLGKPAIIASMFSTTNGTKMASVQHENGDCVCWRLDMLSKPETPEQKAERERIEAAYDLYCLWGNTENIDATLLSMYAFKGLQLSKKWLAIVDKTNYRKGE